MTDDCGVTGNMRRRSFLKVLLGLPACVALASCGKGREIGDGTSEPSGTAADAGYEDTLFDMTFVHRIDVRISEEDWNDLLANPVDKTKYHADVTIDGDEVSDVAFATKGNSSLVFVAADPDSSRYSFKLRFGKYVDGQTYRGLDTLSLNNSFTDATYMKDYLSYELFRRAGVPAPLSSYAWLTVNGEDRGLYVVVEDVNESFLERAFGGVGAIYKPESSDLGLSVDMVDDILSDGLPMTADPHGADFVYKDDDPESYPDIFENAETEAGEEDADNIIATMKCIAEGNDPSPFIDTDEVIRFFAVHNFLLNYDSYTGGMLHNLILHEADGTLSLVPWDYNLAFGSFVAGIGDDVMDDLTDLLNRGIDTPLIRADEDNRPLWSWIVRDDGYREEYHRTLDALIADYYESGEYEQDIDALYELLFPYVEEDPTAFYTPDEYGIACETLIDLCKRRAESVRLQLSGELSTRSDEQDDRNKVDASDIDIMDIGAAFG